MRLFFLEVQPKEAAWIMKISESTYRSTKRNAIKKYRLAFEIGGILIIVILLSIITRAH
jgi:hypothetical protein